MKAVDLPARIAYTVLALPLGGAAGFYACMLLLPQFTANHPRLDPAMDGFGIFKTAILIGTAVAFTAGLLVLTLPWMRHRKRQGRGWRIALSAGLVVVVSAAFTAEGYGLIYGLIVTAWLTYTLAFTFVRYGVVDQARRSSTSGTSAKEYY